MKTRNRIVSLLLALVMLLGMLPSAALAAEDGGASLIPAHGEQLYRNDFEGEAPIAGWKTPKSSVVAKTGGHVLRAEPGGSGTLAIAPEKLEEGNFVASATVCVSPENPAFNPGNVGASAGLVFGYQDDSHFYHFRLDTAGGGYRAQLYQWSGGAKKLGEKAMSWNLAETYTLAVSLEGNLLKCFVNGVQVLNYTLETSVAGLGFGFRAYGCTTDFDDFGIWKLPDPAATLSAPQGGSVVEHVPFTVFGTVANAVSASLTIDGVEEELPIAPDGSVTREMYLPNGEHTVVLTAYNWDKSLTASDTATFTVNAPAAPLSAQLAKTMGVDVNGPVVLNFSAPVKAESVTSENIYLVKGEEKLAATVSLSETDTKQVLVTPDSALAPGTEYAVVVTEGVQDVLGNQAEAPINLPFRTQVDPAQLPLLPEEGGEKALSLNGMWDFRTDSQNQGEGFGWNQAGTQEGWDSLPVPGNWDLENAYANYQGTAWYRRSFTVDPAYEGYPIYLNLTAVYHNCDIWINGVKVGSHDGGYTTFEFKVDSYLNFGQENTISIRVNNSYSVGAWWKWGGIAGDAKLIVRNGVSMDWQHIVPTPNLEDGSATVDFSYKLVNRTETAKDYTIVSAVYDKESGEKVGEVSTPVTVLPTAQAEDQRFSAQLSLDEVKLWHYDDPNLYTVHTQLLDGDDVVHTLENNIGFRKIEIDDTYFYVNGERVRLTGADRVWDDRVNGQMEPDYVIMRDIDYMKSMGMNCARMSHIPMSQNILDYCDEVGFLLICESNVWGGPPAKDSTYGYRCVPWYTEMIDRDYNHPAIFAWSIGNEMHGGNQGTKDYAKFMVNYIKENLDSSRLVTEVSLSAQNPNNPNNPEGDSVYYADFICCNFYGGFKSNTERVRNTYPDKPIFISEYGNGQTSEIPDRNNVNARAILDNWDDLPYVFGASIWTLNDYRSNYGGTPLGQNRVWGVTTVWGDKKLSFERLRAASSPVRSLAVQAAGDTDVAGSRIAISAQMQIRNIEEELPAYSLRGAYLKWEALDRNGQVVDSGLKSIPEMAPDGSSFGVTGGITVPEGGLGAVRATVIDSLGYEIAESFTFVGAPAAAPAIVDVICSDTTARVVFTGTDLAESYLVTAQGGGKTYTATAQMNRYVEFTGLSAGTEYSFTICGVNAAGKGTSCEAVTTQTETQALALPPVIWHTEAIQNGFFVGYSVTSDSDSYEIQYGTVSGSYTDTLTVTTEGGAKVSGLEGGKTYYYRMRKISGGIASAWSEEIAVTTETATTTPPSPVVRGAAASENAVSITIDPVWKSTGYTVFYGTDPQNLTESRFIHRAEVDQLLIDGLTQGETYYFSVVSHNATGVSASTAPIAATADSRPEGDEMVVVHVTTPTVRFPFYKKTGEVRLSAFSTYEETRELTGIIEGLPQGVTMEQSFKISVAGKTETTLSLPVAVAEELPAGLYPVTFVVKDGETEILRQEVGLEVELCDILFRDDYNEDSREAYTVAGNGDLTIENGKMTVAPKSGSSMLLTVGDSAWTDYTLYTEYEMPGTITATSAGIVFRYQDAQNFYHARVDETGGVYSLQIYKWIGGKASMVASTGVSPTEVYRLKAEVVGDSVSLYLNDVLTLTASVEIPSGKAGLRAYGRTASYENLYVYKTLPVETVKHLNVVDSLTGKVTKLTAEELEGVELTALAEKLGCLTRTVDGVDYTFAGWFTAPQENGNFDRETWAANVATQDDLAVENTIYAYYVNADYLNTTIAYTSNASRATRVYALSTVPGDIFGTYGFVLSTADGANDENLFVGETLGGLKVKDVAKTTVYSYISVAPFTTKATANALNGGLGGANAGDGYLTYAAISNMPVHKTIFARAYYVTLDGTMVYGATAQTLLTANNADTGLN